MKLCKKYAIIELLTEEPFTVLTKATYDDKDLAKEMVKRLRAMEDDNFNNLQLMKHTRLYYLKEI